MKAEMSVSRFFTSSKPKSTTTSSKFKGEDLAYLKNVIRNQHQSAPSQASTKVDSSKDENSRNSNKLSQTKLNMWVQGLDQFEMDIMEKMGSKRRKIAHTFEKEPSFEIFVSLKLFPQSHDYSVSIDSVARRPKCTPIGIYLDRLCNHSVYSSLYILRVKFAKSNPKDVKHVLNDIADNALQCFGESFHFLGSKDDQEYAYFVKLPKEYPSIDSLLDSIAAFSQLKNISLLGLRTGLLVSSVAQVVVNSSNDPVYTLELVLVEDIYNEFSECCSDGAGYISLALAKELPSRVSSGIDISNEGSSLPSWFQVRILCEFGVFKGTLLVLSELEGNVIVLRKSMQKVKGKTKRSVSKGNRVSSVFQFNWQVIDQILLNNDELSKQPSSFIMGIVNAGGNESNYYGKLNVGVLQLLCACGVNIEDIKDGLKNHLMNISLACEDSEHALKLLSSHVRPNSDKSFSAANMASILLKLGVELNESFVKATIRKIVDQEIVDLLMLKIPCYPMAHFLGIPDPYRVLGSDEVFVPGADILLHKQVIVYRYPVLKCSNFGLRTVVHSEKLAAMFQGATKLSKGIIFIGGLSRDIGGDFDGDKFVVIADPLIIENFTPVISTFIQNDLLFPPNYHRIDENDTIPLVQPIVSLEPELLESIHSHSDITSVAIEEDHRFIHSIESSNLSRKLIWEYLFTSESDRLGILWNTWMKFVDSKGGPNSELSLHFAKLQDELLSTRKLSIAQRVLQLQSVERSMKSVKHMLGDNAKRTGLNFDCSGSFKAHIVDFVRNAVESLNLSPHTIVLDPHMKLEGSDEFLKIAQNIFSSYIDQQRELKAEEREHFHSSDSTKKFHHGLDSNFSKRDECENRIRRDIDGVFDQHPTIDDRLKITSAFYEASYLHAYNYLQCFPQKTKMSEEIYLSLSFIWRLIPQTSQELLRISASNWEERKLKQLEKSEQPIWC